MGTVQYIYSGFDYGLFILFEQCNMMIVAAAFLESYILFETSSLNLSRQAKILAWDFYNLKCVLVFVLKVSKIKQ